MDLETREFAAFVGKTTLRVRDLLKRYPVERFEIRRGGPGSGAWPHWMALTEPLDCTSAALVEEELSRAFWFDPRHQHGGVGRDESAAELHGPEQAVYLAWRGARD